MINFNTFSYGFGIWIVTFTYSLITKNIDLMLISFFGIFIMFFGILENIEFMKNEKNNN